MNLNSLSLLPYQILPKCKYVLIGNDLDSSTSDMSLLIDARGKYIGNTNDLQDTIEGILTGINKGTVVLLPEGMSADAAFVLTTTTDLLMPGKKQTNVRTRWIIQDKDNTQYLVKTKRRKGCLFQYVCEYISGPNC